MSFRKTHGPSFANSSSTNTSSSVDSKLKNVNDDDVPDDSVHRNEVETLELASRWGFNATRAVTLTLPSGVSLSLLPPHRPSCSVALPMLKHLAEFSYRPNDLSAHALELFMTQDYAGALKLFDEAAELGLEAALLNSAFLYKYLLSSPLHLQETCRQMIASPDNRKHCENHFKDTLQRRLVQLADMGNPDGLRELGDSLAKQARSAIDTGGHHAVAVMDGDGSMEKRRRVASSSAGELYAYTALKFKDITSLMSLAQLVQNGDTHGIVKNITLAKALYRTAIEWELGSGRSDGRTGDEAAREKVYTYNDMGVTTGGVAPAFALFGLYVEEAVAAVSGVFRAARDDE